VQLRASLSERDSKVTAVTNQPVARGPAADKARNPATSPSFGVPQQGICRSPVEPLGESVSSKSVVSGPMCAHVGIPISLLCNNFAIPTTHSHGNSSVTGLGDVRNSPARHLDRARDRYIPKDVATHVCTGTVASNVGPTASTCVLSLTHSGPRPSLCQIFPPLCNVTRREQLLAQAESYLPFLAPKVAAQYAITSGTATDLMRRVDTALIDKHCADIIAHGLVQTMSSMASHLRDTGLTLQLQPTPLPRPPHCQAQLDTVPPPPAVQHVGAQLHQLAMGSAITPLPSSFIPSHPAHSHTFTHTHNPPPIHQPRPSPIPGLDLAIESLVAKDQRNGRTIIVPESIFHQCAQDAGIDTNINKTFVVRKRNSDAGRLVADITRSGLNSDTLAQTLETDYGRIKLPTIADVCSIIERVAEAFPNQPLGLLKMDYSDWYNRILLPTLRAPLYAFRIYIDGAAYIVLLLVKQFRAQVSNYESNFVTSVIYAMQLQRGIDLIGSPFSTIYIDDGIATLPMAMLAAEADAFTRDTEAIAGKGAMNKKKQEIGVSLAYLSWQINVEDFSLTMTLSLYLKLVCVLFLELPTDISTATVLPLKLLQRLSSYMLLAAHAIPALRPFAYGAAHNTAIAHRHSSHRNRHQQCRRLRTTVSDIAMAPPCYGHLES
jgi:hypothetical protein